MSSGISGRNAVAFLKTMQANRKKSMFGDETSWVKCRLIQTTSGVSGKIDRKYGYSLSRWTGERPWENHRDYENNPATRVEDDTAGLCINDECLMTEQLGKSH